MTPPLINIERAFFDIMRRYDYYVEKDKPNPSPSKEIKTLEFWRSVAAEFLATFLFVILLCGACVPWPDYEPSVVQISLAGGLAIASLVQCFGHISGGHINPAVTFAMAITRKLSILRAFLYAIAQCCGGIAGAGVLYGFTAENHRGALGATTLHEILNAGQGFGVEFILTFLLVFTVFATVDPHRKELGSSSLAIGLVVLTAHLTGVKFTGTGINPARSLGPSLIMNKWEHHWIYWVGPLIGGGLAGLIYEYLFDPNRKVKGLKEALEKMQGDQEEGMTSNTPEKKSVSILKLPGKEHSQQQSA